MASDADEQRVVAGLLDGEKRAQHEINILSTSTLADKAGFAARVALIKDIMSDLRAYTRDLDLLAEEQSTCAVPPSSRPIGPSHNVPVLTPAWLPLSSCNILRGHLTHARLYTQGGGRGAAGLGAPPAQARVRATAAGLQGR